MRQDPPSHRDPLPDIPGYAWRALASSDSPALAAFEQVCSQLDGATHVTDAAAWGERLAAKTTDSIAAVSPTGDIAAAGIIEYLPGPDSERAFLDGRVHPDYRQQGIGAALLRWMEQRARQRLREIPRDRPRVLRIMYWDRSDDAIALFRQHGFQRQYVEEEMRVDLKKGRPARPLPSGMACEQWTRANAPEFYLAYRDAFSTRTDHLLAEEDWTDYWANPEDPEFHPELSFLVRKGEDVVAFSIGHVYEPDQASIAQFGVGRQWRGRGVGGAVLNHALNLFTENGYHQGVLNVNINNAEARHLYQRAGFQVSKRFTMYFKMVG